MDLRPMITPANVIAALLTLIPMLVAAFFARRVLVRARLPLWAQILCPAGLCAPYVLVTCAGRQFAGAGLHSMPCFPWGWRRCLRRRCEPTAHNAATGEIFWCWLRWGWPSIFAGLRARGRRIWPF